MDFARETLFDVIEEVQPLLADHYQELTLNKHIVKLDPMWQEYRLLEQLDRFMVFTAREAGKLCGYNAFFVTRHLHYAGFTTAQNDVLYLGKEHRKGTTALRFLSYCEEQLKALGAQKITYHIKLSLDWRPILNRRGYVDEEVMCAKLLGA